MRRPLLIVALTYVGGVATANFLEVRLVLLFGLSLLLAFATLARPRLRPFLLWPLVFFAGWTHLTSRTAVLSPHDLRRLVGERIEYVTLCGTLLETPVQRLYERGEKEVWRSLARMRVTELRRGTNRLPVFGSVAASTPSLLDAGFFKGQTVEVTGVIRPPNGPVADGLFNYRAYLARHGIHHQLDVESTNDWQMVSNPNGPRRPPLSDRFRDWAQRTLARGLPSEDESLRLVWAMALGWKTALTDEVSEPFMRSGTMHIFAISGLHIALIAGILVNLLRVARIPRAACGLVVIPLLWFYTAATGWQPSAIRSTIMMSIVIGGWALRRPIDLLNSLAGAALIILIWDPQQLFQAGFQLSFFVVLSIALLLPPIENVRQRLLQSDPLLPPELRPRWQRCLDAPLRFVTTSFATSLAAWLGSLPLVAYYFHLLTPVSLVANVIIVPISG
ncbi:MAG TPA: ComEC/Rec2 family competence protein, partial [Verrucomicrobiae bacterium]|nr:ComEC/Rec2 family competence protein [Verrucomicrobiae bacterium]